MGSGAESVVGVQTPSPLSRPESARGSSTRRSGRVGGTGADRIGHTQRCADVGNGLVTAMSLRPRVREPTIRTRIPKLRAWGLSLNGKRVRFLGFVEATDQAAAESAIVDELSLSHKQRRRLVVQELPGKVRATAVSALNLNDEQRREWD